MLVRMVVRTRFVPYARNDQSFFEVILGESATDEFPETIAGDLRKLFQVAWTNPARRSGHNNIYEKKKGAVVTAPRCVCSLCSVV